MSPAILVIGVPTALGGHLPGMELAPSGLRALGLLDRLRARPRLADAELRDAGDLPIDPGFRPDSDRRARNRAAICEFLPRERDLVASVVRRDGPPHPLARVLIIGGDCTAHAGALAGLRAARPGSRLAIAWFDAHGDFNTPDSTPSGNVFGMPFAMICGRGDADLVTAADGPTVDEGDAALFGGPALDQAESRALAASAIAHFGTDRDHPGQRQCRDDLRRDRGTCRGGTGPMVQMTDRRRGGSGATRDRVSPRRRPIVRRSSAWRRHRVPSR